MRFKAPICNSIQLPFFGVSRCFSSFTYHCCLLYVLVTSKLSKTLPECPSHVPCRSNTSAPSQEKNDFFRRDLRWILNANPPILGCSRAAGRCIERGDMIAEAAWKRHGNPRKKSCTVVVSIHVFQEENRGARQS